jgi:hypothetical protein
VKFSSVATRPSGKSLVYWVFLGSLVLFEATVGVAVVNAALGNGRITSGHVEVQGWGLLLFMLTTPPFLACAMAIQVAILVCPGLWLISKFECLLASIRKWRLSKN